MASLAAARVIGTTSDGEPNAIVWILLFAEASMTALAFMAQKKTVASNLLTTGSSGRSAAEPER